MGEPAKQAIADLARAGFPLGLLTDALGTFAAVLASPSAAWKAIESEMAETGITLAGAGAPYACDLPAMLSAIWFWRASGRLAGETVLRDLDPLPLHGFEWEFEVWDNHLACCDGIVEARIDRITTGAGLCFVAPLNCSVDIRFERRLRLSADLLLHSDHSGWRAVDGATGIEQRLDDSGAIARLAALPRDARAIVAIDPRHCVLPQSHTQALPRVHPLPWPCDHFLAVASDADWTTRPQAVRAIERVCDDLGLPFAGSFYLTSLSRRWPAWSDILCSGGDAARFMADRADDGTADAVHGLAWSFEAKILAEWTGPEPATSRVHRMRPRRGDRGCGRNYAARRRRAADCVADAAPRYRRMRLDRGDLPGGERGSGQRPRLGDLSAARSCASWADPIHHRSDRDSWQRITQRFGPGACWSYAPVEPP